MAGIKDLDKLIKGMKPELVDNEFVFSTISEIQFKRFKLNHLMIFKETEGITVITERKIAEANSLPYSNVWKLITLTVYSDLLAVGFLARITDNLAKAGISVNVVSAYYHDHLFVPMGLEEKAMEVLDGLSK
ncbi:MAG: ACT domain-containing protein [Candidatus Woesearchaeota archaeon]